MASGSTPEAAPVTVERTAAPAGRPVMTLEDVRGRDIIIAIDAGHGGRDPGAVGKRGTREKDIVLKVARKLEREVRRQKGMKPSDQHGVVDLCCIHCLLNGVRGRGPVSVGRDRTGTVRPDVQGGGRSGL